MMLRNVMESDLPTFFEHQRDEDANAMAVFPAREWDAFISHWRNNVLGNPANETRTILLDGKIAGYVTSWGRDGRRLVAYWIGKEYWGRGVASSALDEFLKIHERRRPVHAEVALSNTRSIRVLEKCGFERVGEPVVGSDGVAEVLFHFGGATSKLMTGVDGASDSAAVIDALRRAPEIVVPLVREVPADILKRRPAPRRWSAHEHACHLSHVHSLFFDRLEYMLSTPTPVIQPYLPGDQDPDDMLLRMDLDAALARYVSDRHRLVARLEMLTPAQWARAAEHAEYRAYSVFIMFRHLALHDFLHAYRIEELLLRLEWRA